MMTLVLDMGYQPINTVPFTRALRYVVKGKVDVIENYVQSIHPDWQMPAVVRLTHWIKRRKTGVKFSRQNVLARDRWRCAYCGERKPTGELTFDHIVPKSRGGRTTWQNIATACIGCNLKKGSQTPDEAGMKLRIKPVQPTWLPLFNMSLHRRMDIPVEWRDYWTIELED